MTNTEFVRGVKSLMGTPYTKCDCIHVITNVLGIKCSGTNWLFRSTKNSSKYRYLSMICKTSEGVPPTGAVVFKTRNKIPTGYSDLPDAYHCGVVDSDGYVIHSSPSTGVRKDTSSHYSAWSYFGLMKQVEYVDEPASEDKEELTDHEMIKALYNKLVK